MGLYCLNYCDNNIIGMTWKATKLLKKYILREICSLSLSSSLQIYFIDRYNNLVDFYLRTVLGFNQDKWRKMKKMSELKRMEEIWNKN